MTATALADGTTASSGSGGGASVAVVAVTSHTKAYLDGAASASGDTVAVRSTSVSSYSATAKSTTGGAQDDGGENNTESKRQLSDNKAKTSDGSIKFAGAVAVVSLTSDTSAYITSSGAVAAGAGDLTVAASSTNTAATVADGTATGESATGVGVAVAITVADVESAAYLGGNADVSGTNIVVEALVPTSTFSAQATSGSGAASSVGVAGSLALNVATVDAHATIATGASVSANGGNVTLRSTTDTSSTAKALPKEGTSGGKLGIGASVAINVATNSTRAEIEDGAVLNGAHDLTLTATGKHAATTEAKGGAAGGTAVTPVVAIAVANNDTLARLGTLTSGALSVGGNLTLEAKQDASADTSAEGDAQGSNTAIGASLGLTVDNDKVSALIARDVTAASGTVAMSAVGTSNSRTRAKAAARGAKDEDNAPADSSVDEQVGKQRKLGDDSATDASSKAKKSGTTKSPKASTSDGAVTVAAAVGINIADSKAEVGIADGVTLDASGALTLTATNNADASASADGSATTNAGGTGVGAAVALNVADVGSSAHIGDATVGAQGIALTAGMTDVPVIRNTRWARKRPRVRAAARPAWRVRSASASRARTAPQALPTARAWT